MNRPAPMPSFVPDYESECGNCGQTPTVTIIENGVLAHDFEMCGACTFGEAAALDPENW